jgi:hypothetical protein
MSAAQLKAQANFKKAIAYRKKTGCSLKEAFAYVKGGKVTGLEKVIKKGNKTSVLYTKKAKKKATTKKKVSQRVLFGVKKKAYKKSAVKSTHKDTKSHNMNIAYINGQNKTYDIVFNDDNYSNSKGFEESLEFCKNYIKKYNGTNESYFADYKNNGLVQIYCNETGACVFTTSVKKKK